MFRIRKIDSFDLPELQPYRTMRRQQEQRDQGIFVAEGEKVVRRLLESRLPVISLLLPEKWLPSYEPLLRGRAEEVQVFVAEKKLLETLTGFSMYQGLLAIGKVPAAIPLEDLLAKSPRPRLLAAVDGLASAENIGALVRNCVAFGAQGLIVGETSGSPYLRRAVRNSMGTVFQLAVNEVRNLTESLRQLRAGGIRCIAAHPHTDHKTILQADFTSDVCIVLGSEGNGISPAVLAECDEAVSIPMPPTVDSLNVGAAAAVFLYEARRQRGRF